MSPAAGGLSLLNYHKEPDMERWEAIWEDVRRIREVNPLVLNVTNNVVTNTTANALLALGASPAMSHAPEDAEELAGFAGAVVLNMGTPAANYVESMIRAARAAGEIPVVLDPVAAGATSYRRNTVRRVLDAAEMAVIRGNASEIMALAGMGSASKGVDSLHDADEALDAARTLSLDRGCVVCVSGVRDMVTDGDAVYRIEGGHPMMPKVTGLGCTASALIGAFCAVNENYLDATGHAMAVMGIAGELAAEGAPGPGTLQYRLYDMLYLLNDEHIRGRLCWEEA